MKEKFKKYKTSILRRNGIKSVKSVMTHEGGTEMDGRNDIWKR